jgi:hypothetical protein
MRELSRNRWLFEEWQAVAPPPLWEASDQVQAYFEELGELFGIQSADVIQIVQEYRYEADRLFKRCRDRLAEELRRTPLTDWWEQTNVAGFGRDQVRRLSVELFDAEPFYLSRSQREQLMAALQARCPAT